MDYINKKYLKELVKKDLSNIRFNHTLGVAKLSVDLAAKYHVDENKAWTAAILHDWKKNLSVDESNKLVDKYHLDYKYMGSTNLAHSKLAAEAARLELGIIDEDILNAIKFHTTGRKNMSMLEKIVFVADTCEEGRNYKEAKMLREKAFKDIDSVCLFILEYLVKSLSDESLEIDEDTNEALEFFKLIDMNKRKEV
ncbi:bis(5'-nucleosyl)-tetraphosphatase (symmetrical) YqeK [Eubacteriales bacterium KG127]